MKMSAEQRKTIYGRAIERGIYEKGNKNDALHDLVHQVSGKASIAELTEIEALKVIERMGGSGTYYKAHRGTVPYAAKADIGSTHEPSPQCAGAGMATQAQKRKVWAMMYQLEKLSPRDATLGARLCGVIKKYAGVDAVERDPFRFVTAEMCWRLIEGLKMIVMRETLKKIEEREEGKEDNACGRGRAEQSPAPTR